MFVHVDVFLKRIDKQVCRFRMLFSYHDRKSETVVMYVANSFFHSVNRLQRVVYTASQAISAEPRISTARKNAAQKAWKKVCFF